VPPLCCGDYPGVLPLLPISVGMPDEEQRALERQPRNDDYDETVWPLASPPLRLRPVSGRGSSG